MSTNSTESGVVPDPKRLRSLAWAIARRPDLWWAAASLAVKHRRDGWWRRAPYLPVPDASWLAFRRETAFADPEGLPTPHELTEYLEWSATM